MPRKPPPQRDLPPPGVLVIDDDGATLRCHVCGRPYSNLGIHAAKAHGLSNAEYTARFDLNRTTHLASPTLKARLRDIHSDHLGAVRPPGTVADYISREARARNASQPRRQQFRLGHPERQRQLWKSKHPRRRRRWWKRPQDRRKQPGHNTPANNARALLLQDETWRARWREAISKGRTRQIAQQQLLQQQRYERLRARWKRARDRYYAKPEKRAMIITRKNARERLKRAQLREVKAGVCPDCHRHFANLARHIARRHS